MSTDGTISVASKPTQTPRDRLRALARWVVDGSRVHLDDVTAPHPARPRLATALIIVAQLVSIAAVTAAWKRSGALITAAPAPAPVQAPTATTRFGLREEQRRAMFLELATAEQSERQRAILQNSWGGHAWSREDDLGYVLRQRAREAGQRYGLSITHAYLVFDEGIRQRWPGPDGQPLPATTSPLSLRTE
jgi:hypothetical protein